MTNGPLERKLRQQIQAERLLGAEAVPIHRDVKAPAAAAVAAETVRAAAAPHAIGADNPPAAAAPAPGALFEGEARGEFPATAPPAVPTGPRIERSVKLSTLAAMDANEVRGCTKCELCKGRTQTVFGEGDPDAQIMFIGEGPGETEDQTGRPFVGRAGEKLNDMITAMGLRRDQVYIANVVKCRPPNNRTPTPVEVDACWDYLLRQVETVQPRAIVTLGGPATKKLLQTDRGITSIRGTWQVFTPAPGAEPIPLMPTFHPAYLLRAYTPDNRRKVWSDLKKVLELLKG